MKIKTAMAIGLLYGAGFGYGALIEPVSVNLGVSASGSAVNTEGVARSFSTGQLPGNASGSVYGSDPVVAWPAAGSQHAEASATQDSLITEDTISNAGRLIAYTRVPLSGPPYGIAIASASSIFEITFRVFNPLLYELTSSRLFTQGPLDRPEVTFSFSSPLYGSILGGNHSIVAGSGILMPDIYTIRMNETIFASGDPLGDFSDCSYNMALRVASVPEGGSSLWMLWAGLGAIVVYSRKLA